MNLTLLTDLYQLTMAHAYYKQGVHNRKAVFDLYFRHNGRISYAVAAGLEQACTIVNGFSYSDGDIEYLKSLALFDADFLNYLKGFKFTGDIYAVPEGTVVFPDEPILTVHAPLLQAQLLETALLTVINHQTLIATKSSYICEAAGGNPVTEFGLRRAQGPDAGLYGARAAVIGGCAGTSNVLAGKLFGVKVAGTMSHSYVMALGDEYKAFSEMAKLHPDNCMLLVDTYDTLKSGVPNAIRVFNEMKASGRGNCFMGIRLDSGDISYLSKKARSMLDAADLPEVKIMASNELDENIIHSLKAQGARIDLWGVGTKLITSGDMPSLGGVYKMSAFEDENGELQPKMKISNTVQKITNPGFKEVFRLYEKATDKAIADLIALRGESLDFKDGFTIIHPSDRWKKMTLAGFYAKPLLVQVYKAGRQIYSSPSVYDIQRRYFAEMDTLWEEIKRVVNPEVYKVDISDGLYGLKHSLLGY